MRSAVCSTRAEALICPLFTRRRVGRRYMPLSGRTLLGGRGPCESRPPRDGGAANSAVRPYVMRAGRSRDRLRQRMSSLE